MTLGKTDFPTIREPFVKTGNSYLESIACDSMRMSPDSASTGPAASLGGNLSSDCALLQSKIFHIAPLKPQVPFIEAESESESEVLERSAGETAFELQDVGSNPAREFQAETPGVPSINIWDFKEGVEHRMKYLLDFKVNQVQVQVSPLTRYST